MHGIRKATGAVLFVPALALAQQLTNASLAISIQPDGTFQIAARPILRARPGAQIDGQWVRSSDYPQHRAAESAFQDGLGSGRQVTVTFSGLAGKPDLTYRLQLYE